MESHQINSSDHINHINHINHKIKTKNMKNQKNQQNQKKKHLEPNNIVKKFYYFQIKSTNINSQFSSQCTQ